MTDNEFLALFIAFLAPRLPGVVIKQANQPTSQGAESGPAIYIARVTDTRIGSPEVSDAWNEVDQEMVHTETQGHATTWQLTGLVPQNPADLTGATAADVLANAAMAVNSRAFVELLAAHSAGVGRITDIRNPFFTDDTDRFAASPSFDFTITHRRTQVTTVPAAASIEFRTARV